MLGGGVRPAACGPFGPRRQSHSLGQGGKEFEAWGHASSAWHRRTRCVARHDPDGACARPANPAEGGSRYREMRRGGGRHHRALGKGSAPRPDGVAQAGAGNGAVRRDGGHVAVGRGPVTERCRKPVESRIGPFDGARSECAGHARLRHRAVAPSGRHCRVRSPCGVES